MSNFSCQAGVAVAGVLAAVALASASIPRPGQKLSPGVGSVLQTSTEIIAAPWKFADGSAPRTNDTFIAAGAVPDSPSEFFVPGISLQVTE